MEHNDTPDWEEIKIEYVTENISYEKLAQRHKLSFSTLTKRAYREGWTKQRENYRNEVAKKIYNRMSNAEAKKFVKVDRSLQKLAQILEDSLSPEKQELYKYMTGGEDNPYDTVTLDVLNSKQASNILELLREVTKQMSELYGVLPLDKIRELELEAKRIEADAHSSEEEGSGGGVIALPVMLKNE